MRKLTSKTSRLLVAILLFAGFFWSVAGCTQTTQLPDLCNDDSECKSGEICMSSRCKPVAKKCDGGACNDGDAKPDGNREKLGDAGEKTVSEPTPDSKEPVADGKVGDDSPDTPPKDENQPKICSPNRDGILQRNEMLFKLGTSVLYARSGTSSSPVDVDLKGVQKDGGTFWDFSKELTGTTREVDELIPLSGLWYASTFKDASYTAVLDRSLNLYGVYKVTKDALFLLGSASKAKNQVKVSYDKPIPVLKFPLKVGSKWEADATSSGTFNLAPYRATETYKFEADAKGKLKTANGTYDVIRLRVEFTQQQILPALFRRTRKSVFFAAECYGFVAIVDSKDYETSLNFTKAARLKRLSD